MKARLYIWMPTWAYPGGLGHAALEVETEGAKHYITWLANGDPLARPVKSLAGPHYPRLGPGPGRRVDFESEKDTMEEYFFKHREPHHRIELPGLRLSARKLRYGLDFARVVKFWQDRLNDPPKYAFLSKKINCTGCVAEALAAGGLGYYAKRPTNLLFQDARTLLTWAEKAQRNLRRLNDTQKQNEQIEATMRGAEGAFSDIRAWHGIPSLADWKTVSNEGVKSRFASRTEQVAAIDGLIERYHGAAPSDRLTRYALLIRMQNEIHSHLTHKPQSDRRRAVIKLGAAVASTLEGFATHGVNLHNLLDLADDHQYSEVISLLLKPHLFLDDDSF